MLLLLADKEVFKLIRQRLPKRQNSIFEALAQNSYNDSYLYPSD